MNNEPSEKGVLPKVDVWARRVVHWGGAVGLIVTSIAWLIIHLLPYAWLLYWVPSSFAAIMSLAMLGAWTNVKQKRISTPELTYPPVTSVGWGIVFVLSVHNSAHIVQSIIFGLAWFIAALVASMIVSATLLSMRQDIQVIASVNKPK